MSTCDGTWQAECNLPAAQSEVLVEPQFNIWHNGEFCHGHSDVAGSTSYITPCPVLQSVDVFEQILCKPTH